jgi:nitrous oxide reductase accessory protein NosL
MKPPFTILPVILLISALSCGPGAQAIRVQYLKTECGYCRMIFQDRAFGAEMQLDNDSLLVFDATECLAAYMISNRLSPARVREIWSVDYSRPTRLLGAREAVYIRSSKILSPMGVNIAAFQSEAEADSAHARIGGERMDWKGVVRLVNGLWFQNRADPDSLG